MSAADVMFLKEIRSAHNAEIMSHGNFYNAIAFVNMQIVVAVASSLK